MRQVLPHRRECLTCEVEWKGRRYSMTIGFDEQCRPKEVFADGSKAGSDNEAEIDDDCILLSLLLQHGCSGAALHRHLHREATEPGAPAASFVALIAGCLAQAEKEFSEAAIGGALANA